MTDYIFLFSACVCIAMQFTFNKFYEKKAVEKVWHLLFFPVITAVFSAVLFFALNKFGVSFGAFSVALAALNGLISILSLLCGIAVVKRGSVLVYTVFMMLGGMFLPYLYGMIFLGEPVKATRIIGILIMIFSLWLSVVPEWKQKKASKDKLFYLLCIAVFLLNGSVSVISKAHQIHPSALPTGDFLVWNYFFQLLFALICFALYFICLKDGAKEFVPEKRYIKNALLLALGYSVFCGLGYFLQLVAAKNLDASLLYPVVTGGTIFFTTVSARLFFKEKITAIMIVNMAFILVAMIVFII